MWLLLGNDLWKRNFGAEPNVVGQTVKLDGIPYTVVGIMPPAIPYPFDQVDAWLPPGVSADEHRGFRSWKMVGRLREDATQESASAELTALADGLADEFPAVNAGMGARLVPLREDVYGEGPRYGSVILLTAALFVLLIACCNVANLLLARGFERHHELAIRTALGARRGHLVRQLLTESIASRPRRRPGGSLRFDLGDSGPADYRPCGSAPPTFESRPARYRIHGRRDRTGRDSRRHRSGIPHFAAGSDRAS